jgi:hypothetical protein
VLIDRKDISIQLSLQVVSRKVVRIGFRYNLGMHPAVKKQLERDQWREKVLAALEEAERVAENAKRTLEATVHAEFGSESVPPRPALLRVVKPSGQLRTALKELRAIRIRFNGGYYILFSKEIGLGGPSSRPIKSPTLHESVCHAAKEVFERHFPSEEFFVQSLPDFSGPV